MSCLTNEVVILKATSVKIDPETLGIITFMYHTPSKENRKTEKSFYRYEGRVVKIADLEAEIADLKTDAKKLEKWRWPTKSSTWDANWFLGYDKHNDNAKAAAWYRLRLKKALEWDDYVALVRDGVKKTGKGTTSSPNSKYDVTPYALEGDPTKKIDILDKASLLSALDHCFENHLVLKRSLPKQSHGDDPAGEVA